MSEHKDNISEISSPPLVPQAAPPSSSSSSGPVYPLPSLPPLLPLSNGPASSSSASMSPSVTYTLAARDARAYREKTKVPKFDSRDPVVWLQAMKVYLSTNILGAEIEVPLVLGRDRLRTHPEDNTGKSWGELGSVIRTNEERDALVRSMDAFALINQAIDSAPIEVKQIASTVEIGNAYELWCNIKKYIEETQWSWIFC